METGIVGIDQKPLVVIPKGFDITKPEQALDLAKHLKQYAIQNSLTCKIQGKDYAMVEAWGFAGSQLGIIPIMQSCDRIEAEGEIKYKATVRLENITTGKLMGQAFAICSNKESKKKTFDEYAIASMAQTRATGKAYRLLIGWFMKASGFEPTPAEEMDETKEETFAPKQPEISDIVRDTISKAATEKILLDYATSQKHLHKTPEFRKLVQDRLTALKTTK